MDNQLTTDQVERLTERYRHFQKKMAAGVPFDEITEETVRENAEGILTGENVDPLAAMLLGKIMKQEGLLPDDYSPF